MKPLYWICLIIFFLSLSFLNCTNTNQKFDTTGSFSDSLKLQFKNPPATAFPGVYWYFMDGNLDRGEMTKDLESMKAVGLGNVVFLEVGIGVPRGQVDFMSEDWQDLFLHAVREAERLDIKILMGAGPGWCGSGGPWVKPEEAMRHLVHSEINVQGGKMVDVVLPRPDQRSTPWHKLQSDYYKDIAVYAIPGVAIPIINDINQKALYERDPYSSKPNVAPYLPSSAHYEETENRLNPGDIIDLSEHLQDDGHLVWNAPGGEWTIIRMGTRVTGASTRPAPEPAIGLESDKLDSNAFANHLANFTDVLLKKTSPRKVGAGWTGFHMDSWESGAQNWTDELVAEFEKRRGYNPEPYFLAYTGRIVKSVEVTERFLWDIRKTCQVLLLENHAEFAKTYAHKNGLELTIEPYDMNPAGDFDLGAVADVIMAEFWSKRFGYQTAYSVVEATSISHITGQPVVAAECFTSDNNEAWQEFPWSMKDQSDWALALGVNRFYYHTFAHKPLGDEHRPGMTMGPYGVHWDRGQTWWPMVGAYHQYISRCSHMMQQGQAVSDILYLTPEGAPMVFTPPNDALEENGAIPDKLGIGFDGCSPKMLIERAQVENGKIVFRGASSYELLVLPGFQTMTPELLEKITSMVKLGAKIIGAPPIKSPSLSNYPECDDRVRRMAEELWGSMQKPDNTIERKYGIGTVYWGGELTNLPEDVLYPSYGNTVELLAQLNIAEDFKSENNSVRYGHRETADMDIYFVANRTDTFQRVNCTFRALGLPELWITTTGETREIDHYSVMDGTTTIPLEFFPYESYFITFTNGKKRVDHKEKRMTNFPVFDRHLTLEGAWKVSFDSKFGGPDNIEFNKLQDWTQHEMRGIKYYSGIATYNFMFAMDDPNNFSYLIDLGKVHDIARVRLNGKDVGVVWCAPWQIDITDALQKGENYLEIEIANRWINRLLGDRLEPDANVRTVKFKNGLMGGKEYRTGRYTFTTEQSMRSFNFREPLTSGLLGPVTILRSLEK